MQGRTALSTALIATACLTTAACLRIPVQRGTTQEDAMDNQRLQALIEGLSNEVEGESGYWSFTLNFRQVMVITDAAADRMRIMTPVVEDSELSAENGWVLLEANFDRVLDARYALARGYVWSVFIHPMSPLTEAQFTDGLSQVATLADTFGTSYTSSGLVFQDGQN